MATKAFDPTANPFELLANAESAQDAPARRQKGAKKEEEDAGAVPTPAAKAQARQAKEAAKTKPDPTPAEPQTKEAQAKKKLNREQFLEEKKKGTLPEISSGPDADGFSLSRPPRARGEVKGTENKDKPAHTGNGERGRGGRGRGGRGGRGRSDGERKNNGDREHHHQAPAHGREFDKKSGMKTGRHPVAKKGGAGDFNWGTETEDVSALPSATAAANAAADVGSGDDPLAVKEETEKKTDATEAAPAAPAEEDDGKLTMDDYLKKKAEKDAELAAKLGSLNPRKIEAADLSGFKENEKFSKVETEAAKAEREKAEAAARKGERVMSLDEIFIVTAPPVSRGGRGRRDDGERRGPRNGGQRREGGRGNSDNAGNTGNTGNTERRGGRGGAAGGRGGRGAGRGAGGNRRGGRGAVLDSNNTHHYPELGSDN